MLFAYDTNRSTANKANNGIDFEQAKELWNNPVLQIAVLHKGEKRFAVIGAIQEKHWTAIITKGSEAIHLISCRRSHAQEVALYEQHTKGRQNFRQKI